MIEDLKWDTLEMRRRRFRLTLMYKLTHGPIDIDSQKYFIQHSESHMSLLVRYQVSICVS